jgi:hypothetical protein
VKAAHTVTNPEVLPRFIAVDVRIQEEGGGVARIDVVRR